MSNRDESAHRCGTYQRCLSFCINCHVSHVERGRPELLFKLKGPSHVFMTQHDGNLFRYFSSKSNYSSHVMTKRYLSMRAGSSVCIIAAAQAIYTAAIRKCFKHLIQYSCQYNGPSRLAYGDFFVDRYKYTCITGTAGEYNSYVKMDFGNNNSLSVSCSGFGNVW